MKALNLQHLAIILDGNRRWGKQRGLKMSADFYVQSGLLGLEIAQAVFERRIPNLSIWIGSVKNLTERPTLELEALNKAYSKFFSDKENIEFLRKRRIGVECIGRWRDLLKPETVKVIEKTLAKTAEFSDSGRRLTVLLGYDGAEERGAALKSILSKTSEIYNDDNKQAKEDFFACELPALGRSDLIKNADTLRKHSWTGHLPNVDLIIRTGVDGDPHNSAGFLSMLVDNTQYEFLKTLWPDFTPELLDQILDNFAMRERRLGK